MATNIRRLTPFILFIGDFIALFVFVFIGQSDHETLDPVNPLLGALLLTMEFALPWLVAGWLLGAFEADSLDTRRAAFFARAINAWFVAGPMAILIRALVLGRVIIPTPFFIVAMILGGAFVLAWRIIFVIAGRLALRPATSHS